MSATTQAGPGQSGPGSFLRVRDLNACSAFYRAVFGPSATSKANGSAGVQLPGGATLVLVGDHAGRDDAPSPPQHIRLPISLASPAAWERNLFLSGVPIEKWHDSADATTICLRDVEGNLLELTLC